MNCTHHWRIEEPHDGLRMLPGVCQLCGAERMHRAGERDKSERERRAMPGIGVYRDQERAKSSAAWIERRK